MKAKINKSHSFQKWLLKLGLLTLIPAISLNALVHAQSSSSTAGSNVLSTEGIVGDIDQGRRAPVLTYSTEVSADLSSARILADTQIINDEYKKYPISVDFYINGKLFSKQFRSIELPAPLGIDVPRELAPIPFNYSIVATLLHPNRQYVTVAQGAVTGNNSTSSNLISCTANETLSGGQTGIAITNTVDGTLNSDNSFIVTLTNSDQSAQINLVVTPSTASTSLAASGTVDTQMGQSAANTYDVTGTLVASGSTISSIDVTSSAGELSLKCSPANNTSSSTSSSSNSSSSSSSSVSTGLDTLAAVLSGPSNNSSSSATNWQRKKAVSIGKADGVEVVN